MGRLVVSEFITLDGVVEAPGGEFHPDGKTAWVVPHFTEETGAFKLNELHDTDALLLGRATYEQFAKAWPTAADEQGFADRMNSLPKYVASTSLDEPLEWNSTLIKGDISEVVAELKGEYKRDILIAGSAGLVHTLIPLGSDRRVPADDLSRRPGQRQAPLPRRDRLAAVEARAHRGVHVGRRRALVRARPQRLVTILRR